MTPTQPMAARTSFLVIAAWTAAVPPTARLNKNARCGQYSETRYSNEAIVNALTVYNARELRLLGTFQQGIVPLRVGLPMAGQRMGPESSDPNGKSDW